jgi:hypothetical protein
MVWGSDSTVSNVRSVLLPPTAREASFPDRFSAAAIDGVSYWHAAESERNELVEKFATDLFAFDQRACSSPRLLVWTGLYEDAAPAWEDFYKRLVETKLARNYNVDASVCVSKLASAYMALHDLSVEDWQVRSPALTTIHLSNLDKLSDFKRVNYGFGLLLATHMEKLSDFAAFTDSCDQTLSVWGYKPEPIKAFLDASTGHHFIRIVPVGQASTFDYVWDGVNLFESMTRLMRSSL